LVLLRTGRLSLTLMNWVNEEIIERWTSNNDITGCMTENKVVIIHSGLLQLDNIARLEIYKLKSTAVDL
jgi:hypothetical protein